MSTLLFIYPCVLIANEIMLLPFFILTFKFCGLHHRPYGNSDDILQKKIVKLGQMYQI